MITTIRQWIADKLPAWIFLAGLLSIWQLIVVQKWVASYLLPSPLQIFDTTLEMWPDIFAATLSTAQSILWGLGLSLIIGVSSALIFFSIPIARRAVLPFCIFFQTVPIIAIAPLLVIWFGYGQPTVNASAFIVSLFPILANTLTGLQETDPQLKELFRLYKPSRWQLVFKLQIPSAIPYFFFQAEDGIRDLVRSRGLGDVYTSQALHCTALHCTALHCTARHCTALHCTALH